MTIDAPCLTCGGQFTGRPNRRYCSVACRRRMERATARVRRLEQQREREHAALKAAEARRDRWAYTVRMRALQRIAGELEHIAASMALETSPTNSPTISPPNSP